MPLIAIRIAVFRRQITRIDIAESKRIALVIVVRPIPRKQIIRLKLVTVSESFVQRKSKPLIQLPGRTFRRADLTNT